MIKKYKQYKLKKSKKKREEDREKEKYFSPCTDALYTIATASGSE